MKKSIFAKLLIMILCLSLVLCGCAGTSGNNDSDGDGNKTSNQGDTNKNNKGDTVEDKAMASLGNTLSAIFGVDADYSGMEDALESGKITLTVGDYVENVLYINTKDFAVADQLELNIEGVELGAELYVNENELVLSVPGILDDAYGVSFDTLATDLEDSLIWELVGMSYEDFMAELEASLGDVNDLMDQVDPTMNDLAGALEDALECIDSEITEGKATVDGKEVNAIIVTYSMTAKDMENMLNIMIDWFEGYAEEMGDMASASADVDMDELMDSMDEARDALELFFEEGDASFEMVVNINADTGYVMTVEGEFVAEMEGEEAAINLNIDLGEDASKSDEYTMTLSATAEGETTDVMEVVLDREADGSELTYDLSVSVMEMEMFTATLEYDTDSYEYALTMEADGEEIGFDGIFKMTKDEFTFSVENIDMYGEKMAVDVSISIEAVSANKIPKAPRYTNILTMSEDEWADLLTVLSEYFG